MLTPSFPTSASPSFFICVFFRFFLSLYFFLRRANVHFPDKVSYFEGAEDLPGDKDKGVLRMKNGQMVVVYKTDDPHWWIGKVFVFREQPAPRARRVRRRRTRHRAERALGAYR